MQFSSEFDYSAASLPDYAPRFVDVLSEGNDVGYFVVDRTVLGRAWGGFRVATDLSLSEVKILARTMTMKNMLAGVPIGGAKAGISSQMKTIGREKLLDLASRLIGRYIRTQSYFLGTDIGFKERDANQVYELAGSRRRIFSGRLSPGICCAHSVLASIEFVKRMNPRLEAETVALEGFGAMAIPTAKLLTSEGYRIVAVSNIDGTLQDSARLNVEELTRLTTILQGNILSHYASVHPSATFRSHESINSEKCDILIPGARVFSINEETANQVKAKLVCPLANSPITVTGEDILARRGIISVPDLISSSGALIGSFAQQLGASEAQTRRIIDNIIKCNLKNILEPVSSRNPKLLALDIAMKRIKSLEQSERITALRWLTPWLREFGVSSILRALRQYLSIKAFKTLA